MKREAAAVLILRRKGQSINNISNFLGRSCSFVHRILKIINFSDLRKLPRRIVILGAARNRFLLRKLGKLWTAWIFGEGERPP